MPRYCHFHNFVFSSERAPQYAWTGLEVISADGRRALTDHSSAFTLFPSPNLLDSSGDDLSKSHAVATVSNPRYLNSKP